MFETRFIGYEKAQYESNTMMGKPSLYHHIPIIVFDTHCDLR
jgi:hypothetical protein